MNIMKLNTRAGESDAEPHSIRVVETFLPIVHHIHVVGQRVATLNKPMNIIMHN
jgi:hypothetical protein